MSREADEMTAYDDAEEWDRARQLLPQWRRGEKEQVLAACGDNVRLLTKLLVLLDQDERPALIATWSSHPHR